MTLWWIGNAVLLVVVAPVAVIALTGLLRQVRRLNKLADTVIGDATSLIGRLDSLPKLLTTQKLCTAAHGLVGRYGSAILRMVNAGS